MGLDISITPHLLLGWFGDVEDLDEDTPDYNILKKYLEFGVYPHILSHEYFRCITPRELLIQFDRMTIKDVCIEIDKLIETKSKHSKQWEKLCYKLKEYNQNWYFSCSY